MLQQLTFVDFLLKTRQKCRHGNNMVITHLFKNFFFLQILSEAKNKINFIQILDRVHPNNNNNNDNYNYNNKQEAHGP